jgi:DNA-directed RNA polymerase subunit delta
MEGNEKMAEIKQLSLIEAAEQILKQNKGPMTFLDLFKVMSEAKEFTQEEIANVISQFYADFIISAKFVYTGDDMWDLKSRQSIDLWDKDGAYYQEFPEYEEEEEFLDEEEEFEEDELDEEDEEEEEDEFELDEEEEFEDEYEDDFDIDDEEEVVEEDDFDDDKYNEYMDDYEDMYDE